MNQNEQLNRKAELSAIGDVKAILERLRFHASEDPFIWSNALADKAVDNCIKRVIKEFEAGVLTLTDSGYPLLKHIESNATFKHLTDELAVLRSECDKLKAAQQAAVPQVIDKSVTLTGEQLRMAYYFLCPDRDAEQESQELVIQWFEKAHSGAGYYAYYAEYPDEGAMKLEAETPE